MSDSVILIAQVCMYNEVEKGNLHRCLDNLIRYCDRVVIYDDASIDDSVAVAEKYGCHVIRGEVNNQMQELAHKQLLLETALNMGATHLFWLDCDEVLDRAGTMGGLRDLCKYWPDQMDAYSFPEINLWRSQTWQRLDSLFTKARFVRLWKASKKISFNVQDGVHKQLYPKTIKKITEAPFSVIHYGFWDYKKMLVKIGAHQMDQQAIRDCAQFGIDGQGANWLLDERKCLCQRVPDNVFPPGTLPPDVWPEPKPKMITELLPYPELPVESDLPLLDRRAMESWKELHRKEYHGDYQSIFNRCRLIWEDRVIDPINRASLFRFDPAGKVIFDIACGGGWFMLDCLINGAEKVYGFEVDSGLIRQARAVFQELGVPESSYEFIDLTVSLPELPRADIIYSVAMFMHLPFWQACRYFKWIHSLLKPDGEAHLQFYQKAGKNWTMFWQGVQGAENDSVATVHLHYELERAGLMVKSKHLAEGEGVLPLWQMYRCIKS